MALRTLMLRKQIDEMTKALEELRSKDETFRKREEELEDSINEANTEEEKKVVEDAVSAFETEKQEHEAERSKFEQELDKLNKELAETEAAASPASVPTEDGQTREEKRSMKTAENRTPEQIAQERSAFADYIRGLQTRDSDYNMTQGNNGYVVPKTIAEEIVKKVAEICPIFAKAKRYNTKGTLEVPYVPYSTDHVVNVAYANEMAALTASSADFGATELGGFLAGALAKISKKLVNNSDIDIVAEVVDQLAEAFKIFFEHECLVGTENKATGALAGVAAGATVTAAAKSSITADELIDCQLSVPTALQANCAWTVSPATFKAIRKLKDGEGRYLIIPSFVDGGGYTLLGKPVYLSDNMPAMGTANNKAVLYGDYSGLGLKLTEELEIEILTERFADAHAIGVIGWTEIDTKVVNAQKFACIKMGASDPE